MIDQITVRDGAMQFIANDKIIIYKYYLTNFDCLHRLRCSPQVHVLLSLAVPTSLPSSTENLTEGLYCFVTDDEQQKIKNFYKSILMVNKVPSAANYFSYTNGY